MPTKQNLNAEFNFLFDQNFPSNMVVLYLRKRKFLLPFQIDYICGKSIKYLDK